MPTKHLLEHKYFYLWVAEIWTIFIAFMCLVKFDNLPSVSIKGADKYVHFTFYFIFTLLWFLYFNKKENFKKKLFKILIAAIVYGGLIEVAQGLFTETRNFDIFDVLANTTGALFAILAIVIYRSFFKRQFK